MNWKWEFCSRMLGKQNLFKSISTGIVFLSRKLTIRSFLINFCIYTSATDEKSDMGVLRVSCYVPSLKVSRKFTAKRLIPKMVKQAENAEIKTNFKEE